MAFIVNGYTGFLGDFSGSSGGGGGSNQFKFFHVDTGPTPVSGQFFFDMQLVEDGDDENPNKAGIQGTLNNDPDDYIRLNINGTWYEYVVIYRGSDRYGLPGTNEQAVAGVMTIGALRTPDDGTTNWDVAAQMVGYDMFVPQRLYADAIDALPTGSTLTGNRNQLNPGDALIPCFCTGTLLDTPTGPRAVQDLAVGDLVMTRDHGPQPIRWRGHVRLDALDLDTRPHLRPILVPPGALGTGCPSTALRLSPQHRVLVRSKVVERIARTAEALVAVKHLLGTNGIAVDRQAGSVDYFHLMFDRHEVVFSNGAESESFFIGPEVVRRIADPQLAELAELFPEIAGRAVTGRIMAPARPFINARDGRSLAARSARNRKALVAPIPVAIAAE